MIKKNHLSIKPKKLLGFCVSRGVQTKITAVNGLLTATLDIGQTNTQTNQMELKERIIMQASALFFRNGLRAVTMNEVAEDLGISKRTLYEHFTNKEELLVACIQWQHQDNLQKRAELKEESVNPVDFIHRHFRYTVMYIKEVHPNLANEMKKLHPAIWNEQVVPLEKERDEFTMKLVKEGVEQGYFLEETDPEIATKLLYAHVDMMMDTTVFPPERFSRADLFRYIITGFLRSMATQKGLKEIDMLFYQSKDEAYVSY